MADSLRFDNKVVIITGAGQGLGKAYAIEFARRGAKVVVNDQGVSMRGDGQSNSLADSVVQEIVKAGGAAVANYDSVDQGEKIVKTAVDTFGKIDILVNNAGILRDSSMIKLTEEDWDEVIRVHVKGAYSVIRAAWERMRKQKFGRIINTSSGTGLYGNFGQANYGTAKLGLHGLTKTLAIEGDKYNIRINTIVPVGASRMTQSLFNEEILNMFSAEKVAPLVVYLAHESCQTTGQIYDVIGGWVAGLRWQRTKGTFFNRDFTAEDVKKNETAIHSFEGADEYPTLNTDTIGKVFSLAEAARPKL